MPRLDLPAAGRSVEALRLTVAPGRGNELTGTAETRPATGHFATEHGGKMTTQPVSLYGMGLLGGLGPHKWVDRSMLDKAEAKLPDGALPLIVDGGAVLEASRANLFAVRDGALFTPPLDGRILPGITRMRVLEIAEEVGIDASEAELSHDDLRAADEVFLTGSVRGVEPVSALDGTPLATRGDLSTRLSKRLRLAWTGARAALR